MKANSTVQPSGILRYKNPSQGQVRFLIERNDNEQGENWDFQYAEVNGFDTERIIAAIVRNYYTSERVETLVLSFTRGENIIDYMRYQNTRALAEAVVSGKHLKSEVQDILNRKIIEIQMPFNETLSGGDYETLADYAIKAKLYTHSDPLTNVATVFCSYVLPQHLSVLQSDPRVKIIEHEWLTVE